MPTATLNPVYPSKTNKLINWGKLHGSAQELLIANASRDFKGLIVVITADTHSAYVTQSQVRFYAGSKNVQIFPDWETLPYDVFSPHEELISDRLKALHHLPRTEQGVLIVPVSTLMQRLAPVDYVNQHALILRKGETLNIDAFRQQLEAAGYRHVTQVYEHGEYSSRGSLIDLYPMGSSKPVRIDLFDEEIDSLRTFNTEDQLTADHLESFELLPAHEFPLNTDGINAFRKNYSEQLGGDLSRSMIYDNVTQGNLPAGIEYYLPLFFERTATLFDYFPEKTFVIYSEEVSEAAKQFESVVSDRYEQRRHDIERPILPPERLFLSADSLFAQLENMRRIETSSFEKPEPCHNYPSRTLPSMLLQARSESPLMLLQQFLKQHAGRLLFTADSAGRRENLIGLLRDNHFTPTTQGTWQEFIDSTEPVAVTTAPLEDGLWLVNEDPTQSLAVIPESMLFGQQVQQKRRRKKPTRDADAIVRNLTDLTEGSPVVHEEHGVGRFLGMQKLDAGGIAQEFITLEYADKAKLYVPVASLHLISRYTGTSADKAPLHKLGNDQWDKARKKAAQKAHDIAAELLEIHAHRAAQKGYPYALDELEYNLFSDAFGFEETPDQATAIEAVVVDLCTPRPMDRVVCGDVGFGKTEVAMRAAFVAANAGKQVAMIAPTTLLVQQHTQNFKDRFADWPFEIASLSRFGTTKSTKETLAGLASGKINIVIGTHKLIQGTVEFKDLGLVIVDEEHRFGVRHKEQLKKMRANVDMLTMTATPIPRTLNMSLSGLRDLSIIATPPAARHAIKTFINEWDTNTIQEACARELSRGGQVYFLHNEVKSIAKIADDLRGMLPDAKIRYAHGQMPERELEEIMKDFYHQRFQILVATTIIESGIDVPSANTILINRADKLGLAQLHQLRGRVGRSHHKAYAYLIVPNRKNLTPDAKKRLEALESLEELGVGFTLASHDLEIRGAGELLGSDQSGQIQEIGFTMYNDLLERAVKALKAGKLPELDFNNSKRTTVDLGVPALIPDDYLPDVHNRLILYKRIASAEDGESLKELRIEMIDRFGMLPEATLNLFESTRLKQIAQELGILKLELAAEGGRIVFNDSPNIDPLKLIQMVQKRPWEFKLTGQDRVNFEYTESTVEQRVQWVKRLFNDIKQD